MAEQEANLWERLMSLLFPPKCPFCRELLSDPEAPVCRRCQNELPWLEGKDAERKVDFAEVCWSPLAYRGRVPEGVRRYKFGRVRSCAGPFGVLMAQCAADHMKKPVELITWAPLSRKRLRKRGFDQAELLARQVGELLDIPVRPTLRKIRHNGQQSRLEGEAARRANALGAYELRDGAEIRGKRILLIDDVVTSGATLSECARLLCQGGGAVCCLTLAQARKGKA